MPVFVFVMIHIDIQVVVRFPAPVFPGASMENSVSMSQ